MMEQTFECCGCDCGDDCCCVCGKRAGDPPNPRGPILRDAWVEAAYYGVSTPELVGKFPERSLTEYLIEKKTDD